MLSIWDPTFWQGLHPKDGDRAPPFPPGQSHSDDYHRPALHECDVAMGLGSFISIPM